MPEVAGQSSDPTPLGAPGSCARVWRALGPSYAAPSESAARTASSSTHSSSTGGATALRTPTTALQRGGLADQRPRPGDLLLVAAGADRDVDQVAQVMGEPAVQRFGGVDLGRGDVPEGERGQRKTGHMSNLVGGGRL